MKQAGSSRSKPSRKSGAPPKPRTNVRPRADVFSHQGIGGPPGHRRAVATAVRARRAQRAFELLRTGKTFRQIAKLLDVSVYTAFEDCKRVLGEINGALALQAADYRAIHVARTEGIVETHYPNRKNARSAATILAALDRQAKLLGLDAKAESGYSADQVVTLVRGMVSLFLEVVADAELRRAYAAGVRRQLGGLARDVVGETVPEDKQVEPEPEER